MKKILLVLVVFSTFLFAKVNVVVTILPQKTFVEKIGADKVNVEAIVKPGNSPHTYEPKPSQMKYVSNADIYFSIGVEFEQVWLKKFQTMNEKMLLVQSEKGIDKIEIAEHNHGDEEEHKGHNHGEHSLDPHVWLSPKSVKIIAKNIYDSLVKIDAKNQEYYKSNYEAFLKEIDNTDRQINDILLSLDDKAKFVVFHPSWGYFAKDYRLTQVAIEAGGKNPKAKHIKEIAETIKNNYIEVIITAPEFSDKVAKQIAKQSGVKVVKISPLSAQWSDNLITLSKAIANK